MERDNKNPVIIEFNGLPGSGKTTIAHKLQRRLMEADNTCLNYYCRIPFFKSPRFLYLNPFYWKDIVKAKRFSQILSLGNKKSNYLHLLQYIRMYREFIKDKPSDFLIIDQGILQSFVSIAHQNKIQSIDSVEWYIRSLGIEYFPLVVINCNVDEKVANERIEERENNGCRVESMSLLNRQKTLLTQTSNLKTIREAVSIAFFSLTSIEINTTGSIDNNVDLIMSFLNK